MKNSLIILSAVIVFASCSNKKVELKATYDNEKLVRQYFDYFNEHRWKEMADMYIDSAEFKDPSLGQEVVRQNKKQVITKYTELGKIFPDVRDEVLKIYQAGEKHIVVEFVSTGTGPDGSKFKLPVCTIFTIENNKITKDFTYYDNFEDSGNGK
jgi:ketosteroid isomerase-like protein